MSRGTDVWDADFLRKAGIQTVPKIGIASRVATQLRIPHIKLVSPDTGTWSHQPTKSK